MWKAYSKLFYAPRSIKNRSLLRLNIGTISITKDNVHKSKKLKQFLLIKNNSVRLYSVNRADLLLSDKKKFLKREQST